MNLEDRHNLINIGDDPGKDPEEDPEEEDDDEAWDCNAWHYCGSAHTVRGFCIKRAPHAVHECGICGCVF